MNVFVVRGNELFPIKKPYKFFKGDVYVIESTKEFWIWLGSKSYADDRFVAAWGAKLAKDQKKKLKIVTINEGEEPKEFKKSINFVIAEGETPRLVRKLEKLLEKNYRLLEITQNEVGEVSTQEIPIDYTYFEPKKVFVVDADKEIYIWFGRKSKLKERYEASRFTRILEIERKRTPIVYIIEQDDEPAGFREMIEKLAEQAVEKE